MGPVQAVGEGGVLAWAYVLVLAAGVLFALAAVLGDDAGIGAKEPGASGAAAAAGDDGEGRGAPGAGRKVVLAGGVTAFGACGALALMLLGAGRAASVACALVGGLAAGAASHVAVRLVLAGPEASDEPSPRASPPESDG